jgi:hypothetical protein
MHGLIFMTWEKYLGERFGGGLLGAYREAIGESPSETPMASRFYDDTALLAGVAAASRLTGLPADLLLREYGRYFIINGLTGHLCKYILSGVNSAYDLLLTMRDVHSRLRRTADGLTPPLFNYEFSPETGTVVVIYDSPRQVCPVLWGAIEGAAERYGEQVSVVEHTCMKRGDRVCRFEATFFRLREEQALLSEQQRVQSFEQQTRSQAMRDLARVVLSLLPLSEQGRPGITLVELQQALRSHREIRPQQLRPAVLLETIRYLQFAGYVASTAGQPDDNLSNRRYWRVSTYWQR